MSAPRNKDWEALKRAGRYLKGVPRLVHSFYWQDAPSHIGVYCDSDWAGCRESRKSTSGAALMHGSHLIKAYSKTQANIALSSAEAEYYSMVKAASEGLGLRAMCLDYGSDLRPWLYVDASAALGHPNPVASRSSTRAQGWAIQSAGHHEPSGPDDEAR